MTSDGDPAATMRDLTFNDHLTRDPGMALDVVADITEADTGSNSQSAVRTRGGNTSRMSGTALPRRQQAGGDRRAGGHNEADPGRR